jgi:hypothetical protein
VDQFGSHESNTVIVAYGYLDEGKSNQVRLQVMHPARLEKFEALAEKHGLVDNGPAGLRHLLEPDDGPVYEPGTTYFEWERLQKNNRTTITNPYTGERMPDEAGILRTAKLASNGQVVTTAEFRPSLDEVHRHIQQKKSEGVSLIGNTIDRSPVIASAIWQEHCQKREQSPPEIEFYDIDVDIPHER